MSTVISRETPYVLGIDVGGTKILAGVVDNKGQVHSRVKRKTRAERGSEEVIDRIVRTATDAIDEAKLMVHEVSAVGVGIPGPVNMSTGVVSVAPNMGWKDTPVGQLLRSRLHDLPTIIGNDANCSTLGEFVYGAGRGARNVVGVFIGTGIGGGLIIDGQLYTGKSNAAGEIGHMVVQLDGPRIGGGFRGTMESLGSRLAIVREIEKAIKQGRRSVITDFEDQDDERRIRSKMLARAYADQDKVVVRAVNRSAHVVGIGVASICHCLAPDVVVIGGGVVDALGEPYVKRIEKTARKNLFGIISEALEIKLSTLGDDAGVLGAAAMARQHLLKA